MTEAAVGATPNDPDGASASFERRLHAGYDRLPPAAQRVARYIDLNRPAALSASAAQIGEAVGASDATVVRAVQALGYRGLAEMRRALAAGFERPGTAADAMRRSAAEADQAVELAVSAVLETHMEAMQQLSEPSMQAAIARGVRVLAPNARILVFGIGPSGPLSEYVSLLLRRHGRAARALNATGSALADQLLDLRGGDGLLVLAYGRTYREVVLVLDEARRLQLPLVIVTDSLESRLTRRADVVIPARRGRRDRVALHGVTLIVLEALVMGLAIADPESAVSSLGRLSVLRRELG